MSKNYPENGENLEGFYKEEFSELTIEPSAGLWDKISQALPAEKPLEVAPSFLKRNARILGGAAFLLALLFTFLLWPKKESTMPVTPEEEFLQPVNPVVQEKKTEQTEVKKPAEISIQKQAGGTKRIQNKTTVPATETQETKPVETTIIIPDVPVTQEEIKPEVKPEIKTEKKPESFYEKHARTQKDSVRDLFVPDKK